jgi:hypothetical protein
MAVCGSCSRKPCSCVPTASPSSCPPGRGPDFPVAPSNTPPAIDLLACTPALRRQKAIDRARLAIHKIGQRPYRVRLVWQVQDDISGTWSEDASLELMPVELRDLDAVELIVEQAARKPDGVVNLREVSPLQVDDWTLRGYRNGEPWGDDTATREFFYEVQAIGMCPADRTPRTYRFELAGAPVLRLDSNEWRVRLTTQSGYRREDLVDQTVVVDDEVFEDAVLLA